LIFFWPVRNLPSGPFYKNVAFYSSFNDDNLHIALL
jgi:hypothetical protein